MTAPLDAIVAATDKVARLVAEHESQVLDPQPWFDMALPWEVPTKHNARLEWLRRHVRIWDLERELGFLNPNKAVPDGLYNAWKFGGTA